MTNPRILFRALSLLALVASVSAAVTPPCRPCLGLSVDDLAATSRALSEGPPLVDEARLYVRFRVDVTAPLPIAEIERLAATGAKPWLALVLTSAAPVLSHVDQLDEELELVAKLAHQLPPATHFQVLWEPRGGFEPAAWQVDYPFLFKRASVAITGASTEARVVTAPLAPDPELLGAFYAEDVAAYLDGIALSPAPPEVLDQAVRRLAQLDPGRPVVVDARALPTPAERAVALAARDASLGGSLTFFAKAAPLASEIAPLAVAANEFQGDLSFDPYSVPSGAEAWAFVRGVDLGLRVIVASPEPIPGKLQLHFSDPQLRRPERLDLTTGDPAALFDLRRTPNGLEVGIDEPRSVTVLRLERAAITELEGYEEKLAVETERTLPVEEILRRLQAFDDGQARKLQHYEALYTQHLRFQAGGANTIEATFEGDFFFERDKGFDWAWQTLYFNGVRWKGKTLPEIPLIQPEKAAALPLEIHFSREYRYRLRGTAVVEGRDCWVVDFSPDDAQRASEEKLYQGTVWIDREIYARVRTRALQVGLEGEVISNEETFTFTPLDDAGQPAAWSAESTLLPTRVVGQQLLSVLNTAVVVEKENVLSQIRINGEGFLARRQATLDSDATMVRDTDQGLRYLVKDDTGQRVPKEGFDNNKLFLLGGVFYDQSFDYPLPLAGINYFSFDFKGSGNQTNLFFGGVLGLANLAQPHLFGSKWDAGADFFGIAIPFGDTLYRDGQEILEEEVDSLPINLVLNLGRPIGPFFRLGASLGLRYSKFSRADDTADDFVLPSDHLDRVLTLQGRFSRSGYTLTAEGSLHSRSEWEPWGLPGRSFDPDTKEFTTWQLEASKTFYFDGFKKLGVSLEYADGEHLDRFSKFDFGFFGDVRVHGYRSDLVRAERAFATHLIYGFEISDLLRVEGVADFAWATDEEAKLDNELLSGVGLVGTFMGPWQTIMQFDIGVPVAGPDDGFVAYLVFLKLFN